MLLNIQNNINKKKLIPVFKSLISNHIDLLTSWLKQVYVPLKESTEYERFYAVYEGVILLSGQPKFENTLLDYGEKSKVLKTSKNHDNGSMTLQQRKKELDLSHFLS